MLQVEMACKLMLRLQSFHGNVFEDFVEGEQNNVNLQGPKITPNLLPQIHCHIQEQIMLFLFTGEEVFLK
jgi:hypothetical protein